MSDLTREQMLTHSTRQDFLRMSDDTFCANFESIVRGFGDMKKRGAKKSPSNELTDAVIKYWKLKGGAARRVNTSGQYDEASGQWRPSGMKKGFEDISCILPPNGRTVAIEIKIGRDKLSTHQEARQAEVEKCGGVYLVAKNFDEIKIQIDTLFGEVIKF
jgi:hypothetical protein